MKKSILKYTGYSLLLLALAALWGFTHFFYNPFEGRYQGDVASLIPREVDFYVAKGKLSEDFQPFPRLAVAEAFSASKGGQSLMRTQAWIEWFGELDVEASLAGIEEALAQAPVEINPLDLFGGEDLALAGYFKGKDLEQADWAVYGRLNWMGKFLLEFIDSGFADMAGQGLVLGVAEHQGEPVGVSLSGGELPRPLYLVRIQDVAVIATQPALLASALELDSVRGQNSLLLSAKYSDHIGAKTAQGNRDELEVYVDTRSMLENLQLPGTWPDPKSPELGQALLAKLFQLGSVRELMGTVTFGANVKFDLLGALSSNLLTPLQKKLYREPGFDQEFVLEVARMAAEDTAFFAYGHADIGDLLRETVASLDDTTLGLIEDTVRSVWGYSDVYPLIDDLEACFRDRFGIFVRNNDLAPETGDKAPLTDGAVAPLWSVVLFLENTEKLTELQQKIQSHTREFGIQGRDGALGIYYNRPGGAATVTEYHNAFVPGTGHVAVMQDTGSFRDVGAERSRTMDFLVISNENRLLGQSNHSFHDRSGATRSLADDPYFSTWVRDGLPSSNLLFWWRPEHLTDTLQRMAVAQAEVDILDAIDWSVERPRIEREVIARDFPGERPGAVSPDLQAAVDLRVQEAIDAFGETRQRELLPQLRAQYSRAIGAWDVLSGVLIQLQTDPKQLRLSGRIGYRLDS